MANIPPASQPELRRGYLKQRITAYFGSNAEKYRSTLIRWYDEERAQQIKQVEAWKICKYGH